MRKGFQLLETRLINEVINLTELEKAHSILLPPTFRLFIETFKTPLLNSSYCIVYFPNQEVGFIDFSESLERQMEIYKEEESYNKFGMLPIANSGIHAGGICVGLRGEQADKIYVDNEMFHGRFEPIAQNIFEFTRGLIEVEDGDDPKIYNL